MAEFDFSMDPAELNKEIDKAQEKLSSGVAKLKKYEQTLGESERIILEIAKRRDKIARAEAVRRAEWTASGGTSGFQLGASGPSAARRSRARGLSVPNYGMTQAQERYLGETGLSRRGRYGIESPHTMDVGGRGLSIPGSHGIEAPGVMGVDETGLSVPGGGALSVPARGGGGGGFPGGRYADYRMGPPGGGAGGGGGLELSARGILAAVTAFQAAVVMFGGMVVQANSTRSENLKDVGDTKIRAQRAAKSLGLSEQDVMMAVTSASDPQAALRAHEQWAAKKRRTGIQPPAYAMAGLVKAANEGGIGWDEAAQSGMEGTWGRLVRTPGLTGEAREANQLRRGVSSADYEARAVTWREDREKARGAAFSDAEWEQFKANNPFWSAMPGMRSARESLSVDVGSSGYNPTNNRQAMLDAYGDLPTGAGYGGAPPAGVQTPVQQQGVDLSRGGRGVQNVRIINTEAVRPRPQLDVRSGNNTRTEN